MGSWRHLRQWYRHELWCRKSPSTSNLLCRIADLQSSYLHAIARLRITSAFHPWRNLEENSPYAEATISDMQRKKKKNDSEGKYTDRSGKSLCRSNVLCDLPSARVAAKLLWIDEGGGCLVEFCGRWSMAIFTSWGLGFSNPQLLYLAWGNFNMTTNLQEQWDYKNAKWRVERNKIVELQGCRDNYREKE